MNFLKKRATRTAAAVIMFALALCSAFTALDAVIRYRETESRGDNFYLYSPNVNEEIRELEARLWMVANMYLMNTDENGEIQGNVYYMNSLFSEMKRAGITDINGNLILPETDKFYYTLNYNGRKITNDKDNLAENSDIRYQYKGRIKTDDIVDVKQPDAIDYYCVPPMYESWCYTNTKGMTYFYSQGRGYAVYDYDISGLDYYEDELGARIYLNKNGTSPIPEMYNDTEYKSFDSGDAPLDESDIKIKTTSDVNLELIPCSDIIEEYTGYLEEFSESENQFGRQMLIAAGLIILSALFALYTIVMGGYNSETGMFEMRARDAVYGEIFLFTGFALPVMFVLFCGDGIYDFADIINKYRLNGIPVKIIGALCMTAIYMLAVSSVDTLLNRFKCRRVTDTFFTTVALKKSFQYIKNGSVSVWQMRDDVFTRRFLGRLCLALISGIVAVMISIAVGNIFVMAALCILVIAAYIIESFRDLSALKKLSGQITDISNGNYAPGIADPNSAIYGMTSKLNTISDGIQTAVEEQIRAERMKIELVTNVSHDLKTPLTSIVSYVNLLSREELTPEARDYVAVLEQKTDRLKTIVADVFDLAKATSSTDVNSERLDAVILMNQVLADMSDRMEKYEREIRTEINAESAFIEAEGKKMYRVLQNLLDNAMKYSLAGTRIFVRLDVKDGKVRISVKNTSSYEMTFSPEEITERFVRGDSARTTEGSGLGLSIARSFTEACGGKFKVSIDGDVFRAEVEFDEMV